jgi:hypothetical protein
MWIIVELHVYIDHFHEGGRLFSIRYGEGAEWVALDLAELASYILGLNKPYSRIKCLEQAQL